MHVLFIFYVYTFSWFEAHLQLIDAHPMVNHKRKLEPVMLTLAKAKRWHTTLPGNLRRGYMGFWCKQSRTPGSEVEVRFLFTRFRDVDFKPCMGYDSYQANSNLAYLLCV